MMPSENDKYDIDPQTLYMIEKQRQDHELLKQSFEHFAETHDKEAENRVRTIKDTIDDVKDTITEVKDALKELPCGKHNEEMQTIKEALAERLPTKDELNKWNGWINGAKAIFGLVFASGSLYALTRLIIFILGAISGGTTT